MNELLADAELVLTEGETNLRLIDYDTFGICIEEYVVDLDDCLKLGKEKLQNLSGSYLSLSF